MAVKQPDTPIVLTIAGSDSGGGAGIQADIKTISATGSYACSVITALTAQNTCGVSGISPVTPEFIALQLDAVFSDLNVIAVKTGMLADAAVIRTVAEKLKQYRPPYLVIDPVMVATSGDPLLAQNAVTSLKQELLPLADVITPNLPEAAALLDTRQPQNMDEMKALAGQLRHLGAGAVLLKGGHLTRENDSTDLLILPQTSIPISGTRVQTHNTHGTGCTLSSAIASYLAQGDSLTSAIHRAKRYISQALQHADELQTGRGHGPVHHFFQGHADV